MAEIDKAQVERLLRELVRDVPGLRCRLQLAADQLGITLDPPEDERIFALRELTTGPEAWEDIDQFEVVCMLREGLAAYDELKASLPAGDRQVTELWGVRTRGGTLHTQDIDGYKMTSREAAERAGFVKQAEPEPVLLRRVTTFTEEIG